MTLEAISIPPSSGEAPKRSLVALHGWGSSARDLTALASFLAIEDCQMVFLEAPFEHPSVPGGKMWYDLDTLNKRHLAESRQRLRDFLDTLEASTGVPRERSMLGGFSQGGAMTLEVGLDLPLAGLLVFSGYLHPEPSASSSSPPVLMAHGTLDPVVPIKTARRARETLEAAGASVDYQEFEGGHEVAPPAVERARRFILERT